MKFSTGSEVFFSAFLLGENAVCESFGFDEVRFFDRRYSPDEKRFLFRKNRRCLGIARPAIGKSGISFGFRLRAFF